MKLRQKKSKIILFLVLAVVLAVAADFEDNPKQAIAASTITAATCNRDDVNAVINGPTHTAVDGDIIKIPAGTCTWTTGITVPAGIGISIMGSGTPDSAPANRGASASCSATVITDNMPGGNLLLLQPTASSSLSRISCMKILGQSGAAMNSLGNPAALNGTCNATTCPNIRLDNMTFDGSLQSKIRESDSTIVSDNVFGVIDHNTAGGTTLNGMQGMEFINYNNSAWNGVGRFGDNSWASPDSFGTAQTLYLENNSWGPGMVIGETEQYITDWGGGRIASRFNDCNGCYSLMSNHGTESGGRMRGGRQVEVYGNNFICTYTGSCASAVGLRSGVAIMFGNSLTVGPGAWINGYLSFVVYRGMQSIGGWGACDGTGQYDNNDPTTYFTGTIAIADTSSWPNVITVNGAPGWTTNQWYVNGTPYSIHDATINNGSEIVASGTNTLSVYPWTSIPFAAGDTIQIRKVNACLDQPGRSGGVLLSGQTPTPTGPINQTLDPSYEWNDSGYNPVFDNVTGAWTSRFIPNRDWFTDSSRGTPHAQTSPTSPFNGSSGVGFGTLANRPTSCSTKGVGYFATDQGNWNQSGNSFGQGQLYVCNTSNTWTLAYTPYTYPHPIVSGTVTPPSTLAGDLNKDGIVNSLDWSIMNSKWFTSDATADLNHDGVVNSLDWSIMNSNWFKTG